MVTGETGGSGQAKRRIGDLLLEAGIVSEDDVRAALAEQDKSGGRLCYNLIRIGALKADDLLGFLREQFGVAAVNLDNFQLERSVVELLPGEFAVREQVVPLHVFNDTITVAMIDPGKSRVISEIGAITGLKVDPLITPQASLEKAIHRYYGRHGEGFDGTEAVSSLVIGDEKEARQLYMQSPPAEGYSPMDWTRRFFLQTVKRRSREFHLEPRENGLRARYRVGGKLCEGESAPLEMMTDITDTVLKLSRMDRGDKEVPREGRLKIIVKNRAIIAEVSSYRTLLGTRIVFNIMDEGILGKGFQELGMSKAITDDLSRILNLKTGLLLLSAPPGGGKRTTFYNVLHHLSRDKGRNIMTMEHPIQYPVEGINQTQVSFGTGVDFYFGLKSLLHQNPDVVALSDISDCRTLELVFNAARQCLVVAMAGFNDNLQALRWISNCGVGRDSLAMLLRGLLVQRVLPRNCNKCREQLDTPEELVEGVRDKSRDELVFYSGSGCGSCGETGRSGKLGIFELLSLRFTLRDILARGGDLQVLYDEAQRQGMWTLREDGIIKATQGLVDVRDVLDATRDEEGEE